MTKGVTQNTIASDLRLGGRVSLGSNLGRAKTLPATRAPLIQEHQPSENFQVGWGVPWSPATSPHF